MLIALICVSVYAVLATVAYCIVRHNNNKIIKEVLKLKDIADQELAKLESLKKEAELMTKIEQKLAQKFEYNSNPLHSDIWK